MKHKAVPHPDSDPQQRLSDGMEFNADDLAANRAGSLSQNQITKLTAQQRRRWVYIVTMLSVAIVFTGVEGELSSSSPISREGLAMIGILWAAVILLEFIWIYRWRQNRQELRDGTIQSMEGAVSRDRIHASGKGGGTYYYVIMSGKRFEVRREIYDAFITDHHYRIYVTPISGLLLSAEYLD